MAWSAFALYTVGVSVAFGLRTWLHRRRTGDSGHRHSHPTPWSAAWWAQVLLALGLIGGFAAPLLDAVGVLEPVAVLDRRPVAVTGAIVVVFSFAALPFAQRSMGASWRIGVDASEHTDLVTGGAFRFARNPVFTAMIAAVAGLTAMTPTWAQLATLAVVIAGIELQVRVVEEPYLRATHADTYAAYARRTGRFLPGIGIQRS